ncbi:hypothetical protein LguiA_013459 [Lonicera macranthoides]
MRELDNTVWEDTSYSTLTGTSKKDYKSACVKDYNCDVVLYKDGQCKMQRLPLRFERRLPQESNMALVKIESAPIAERDSPHLPKENRKELEHPILFTIVTVAAFALAISNGELCKLVGDEVVNKQKLNRMVKEGLWCIQDDPSIRPLMKKVLLMLLCRYPHSS